MTTLCPCGAPAKVKFCSRACVGRYNTPLVGVPVGTVLGTCPCGADVIRRSGRVEDLRRKFCSRSCAGRHGGGHTLRATHCPRCGWAKDAGNTYPNGACRRCLLAKGDPTYVPGPKGSPRPKAAPRPRTRAVPAPVAAPAVPAWRPPGWAPVPSVRRVAS